MNSRGPRHHSLGIFSAEFRGKITLEKKQDFIMIHAVRTSKNRPVKPNTSDSEAGAQCAQGVERIIQGALLPE